MNNTNTAEKILLIAMALLGVAGFIFLGISFFGNDASNHSLTAALACVGLAGLFNTIILVNRKNGSNN